MSQVKRKPPCMKISHMLHQWRASRGRTRQSLPRETCYIEKRQTACTEQSHKTLRVTSWITEAVNQSGKGQALNLTSGGARRSVPQIQLTKFSGKPIE